MVRAVISQSEMGREKRRGTRKYIKRHRSIVVVGPRGVGCIGNLLAPNQAGEESYFCTAMCGRKKKTRAEQTKSN
jgi:hypothetical protein